MKLKIRANYYCAAMLVACKASVGATLPDVTIDDTLVFPESLSAAADGSLYIGSWKGIVYRALPGQTKATPWIRPSAENGLLSILGVLVDDRQGRVWVCSVPAPTREPPAPGTSSLMAFDLKTGVQQLNLPLPAPARMSSGPLTCAAASLCWGFRPWRKSMKEQGAEVSLTCRPAADLTIGSLVFPFCLFPQGVVT